MALSISDSLDFFKLTLESLATLSGGFSRLFALRPSFAALTGGVKFERGISRSSLRTTSREPSSMS